MKKWIADITDHVNSNLADVQWEMGATPDLYITRWMWFREYASVTWEHARYAIGALICKRIGHDVEMEDFVSVDIETVPDDGLEHRPRIVDIHGGGCDWQCKRCGDGGRRWF